MLDKNKENEFKILFTFDNNAIDYLCKVSMSIITFKCGSIAYR